MDKLHERIRAEVVALHPGVFNFDRATAARIIGVSAGHLRNRESDGQPIIPTVKVGAKPLYQLPDIVDFLVKQREVTSPRRRGPRTKAERMQATDERNRQGRAVEIAHFPLPRQADLNGGER